MIEEKQVVRLVDEFLKGTNKFLVEVVIRPTNLITVFIDGDNQVSIEDCQRLNRHLEQHMNREMEDFELTVSSAGLDRPLKVLRQFKKRMGMELEVVTLTGEKTSGILLNLGKDGIEIEKEIMITKKVKEKKKIFFPFKEIRTVKEVITIKKTK